MHNASVMYIWESERNTFVESCVCVCVCVCACVCVRVCAWPLSMCVRGSARWNKYVRSTNSFSCHKNRKTARNLRLEPHCWFIYGQLIIRYLRVRRVRRRRPRRHVVLAPIGILRGSFFGVLNGRREIGRITAVQRTLNMQCAARTSRESATPAPAARDIEYFSSSCIKINKC